MKKIHSGWLGLRAATVLSLSALFALFNPFAQAVLAQKTVNQTVNQNVNVKTVTKTLNSSAAHKECTSLTMAQNLRYWFRADGPVNFNIQYQEGGQMVYPVKKDKVSILSGTYSPKASGDVCIVWTNLNQRPVMLSFEFARLPAGR